MNRDLTFAVWTSEHARRIESVLESVLAAEPGERDRLLEAMRYAVLGGGKRLRALLAYAAGELVEGGVQIVDAAAAAVELIHAYSLVHDDLPSMDNDVLRRGKPTCHVVFGEATALLAGDALQSLAFEVLARGALHDSPAQVALLAVATGSRGMAGGQAIDLESVGQTLSLAELERMHRLKTGALIRAAVRLGAACGSALTAADTAALDRYAAAVGLAFQVVDDVLDVEGSVASLGKSAGKDAAQGKPTYATIVGVEHARRRIDALRAEAHEAASRFGARARRLDELADWIAVRTH